MSTSIMELHEELIAEKVRGARERLSKSTMNQQDYREYIQEIFNLGAFSKDDEHKLNKVKHDKFVRDVRLGSYNVKWLDGDAPSKIEVKSLLELQLNEVMTVQDTVDVPLEMNRIFKKNGNAVFGFHEVDKYKSLHGGMVMYKIEAVEYKYKHSKFGALIVFKSGDTYKGLVALDKEFVENCGVSYDKVLKDIYMSLKKHIADHNGMKIVFLKGAN